MLSSRCLFAVSPAVLPWCQVAFNVRSGSFFVWINCPFFGEVCTSFYFKYCKLRWSWHTFTVHIEFFSINYPTNFDPSTNINADHLTTATYPPFSKLRRNFQLTFSEAVPNLLVNGDYFFWRLLQHVHLGWVISCSSSLQQKSLQFQVYSRMYTLWISQPFKHRTFHPFPDPSPSCKCSRWCQDRGGVATLKNRVYTTACNMAHSWRLRSLSQSGRKTSHDFWCGKKGDTQTIQKWQLTSTL